MYKRIIKKIGQCILPILHFPHSTMSKKQAVKIISQKYKEHKIFPSKIRELSDTTIDLTLVIPVYNGEKFLRYCLDSIVNQDTKYKYEIIVINDGSEDLSLQILREYEKKYQNIVVVDQKNCGISQTRNRGIELAKGRYIGFVDNDDSVTNCYVQELLDRAYATNSEMVKCSHKRINWDTKTELLGGVKEHEDYGITGKLDEELLTFDGYIWGGIFAKELFRKMRFPVGYWYEDMVTRFVFMRICRNYQYINKKMYNYSLHDCNSYKVLWNSKNYKSLDQYYLAEQLLEYTRKNFGLENDQIVYRLLLTELGEMLWVRTRRLDRKYRKAIFNLSCALVNKCKEATNLTFKEKVLRRAFINHDYYLWEICSWCYM